MKPVERKKPQQPQLFEKGRKISSDRERHPKRQVEPAILFFIKYSKRRLERNDLSALVFFYKKTGSEKSHKFYLQPFDAGFLLSQRFGIKNGRGLSRSRLFIQFVALKAGEKRERKNHSTILGIFTLSAAHGWRVGQPSKAHQQRNGELRLLKKERNKKNTNWLGLFRAPVS